MPLNIDSIKLDETTGDVTTPVDGQLWYNTTTDKLRTQEGAVAVDVKTRDASELTSGTLDDARVAQSNVTQHQAALSVTASQVSDFNTAVGSTPPQAHALGGAEHTADTLANLNSRVSDATLIDTTDSRLSDARTPTAHASSHSDGGTDEISVENLATAELVTTKFLSPDGAGGLVFSTPAGGGDVSSSVGVSVDTELVVFDGATGKLVKDGNILVANVFDKSVDDSDDITEGATNLFTSVDENDLIVNALGTQWLSGLATTPQGVPDKTVAVSSGDFFINAVKYTHAGTNPVDLTSFFTALTGGQRQIVELYIDAGNTVLTVGGTPESGTKKAMPPAHPANTVCLAYVKIDKDKGTISADEITDCRTPAGQAVTSSDELVKVTADDTTSKYLQGALSNNGNITFTLENAGGDESLKADAPTASTTTAGIVERATQTEVNAGTDTTRYVSPSTLASWPQATDARTPTAHALGGAEHTADTLANLNSKITDATLIDTTDSRLSDSRTPTGAAGGELSGTYPNPTVNDGADATAIHDNVSGEISLITEKVTPVSADLIIIEDSAAGNAKKKVQIGNLPSGGGGGGNVDVISLGAHNAPDLSASSATYNTKRYYAFRGSTAAGTPVSIKAAAYVASGTGGKIRIYDVTNSQVIAEKTNISNTSYAVVDLGTVSNVPTSEAVWSVDLGGDNVNLCYCGSVSIIF